MVIFMAMDAFIMMMENGVKVKQAIKPRNYASLKLILIDLITGVKCRATSVAKRRS